MKKTRKPIGSPSLIGRVDFSQASLLVGPERTPVTGGWVDFKIDLEDRASLMRRPPWESCAWCGNPQDGRPRCDRCGQKHGDAVPPVRWWETNRVDMIWWFEHRMTIVAEAFQADYLVVGEHIERSYPPA